MNANEHGATQLETNALRQPEPSCGASDPCRLCAPLGASLVFKGTEQTVGLLHGSQGCATYIRRYCISHFREPLDIASSSFSEDSVVFGGKENLHQAIRNVCALYAPRVIGVATTCLAETIGDDPAAHISSLRFESGAAPHIVVASTASYRGCHTDGYRAAMEALIRAFARPALKQSASVALVPGILSPSDIRYVKELFGALSARATVLADYSDTLDGGTWQQYQPLPPGGTSLAELSALGGTELLFDWIGAGACLTKDFGVTAMVSPPPVGVEATDLFIQKLEAVSGERLPMAHTQERSRLIDSYMDGHKYVSGIRVLIYAEAPLATALTGFCREIGCEPVMVACPESASHLRQWMPDAAAAGAAVIGDSDFDRIGSVAQTLSPALVIGNSKCAPLARSLGAAHVRVGFPVHDRFGASRLMHVGYRGTQQLFDRIVNVLVEAKQNSNDIGYAYL